MIPAIPLPRRSRRALLLLWLGIVALAMNAFAGMTHAGGAAAGDQPGMEICTHAGIVQIEVSGEEQAGTKAPAQTAEMRCCDLCGAPSGHIFDAVLPSPSFRIPFSPAPAAGLPADEEPSQDHYALAPISPRAPPAHP